MRRSTVNPVSFRADVVVVGSGPGGATLTRELARAGKKVLLLERGTDQRRRAYYGTYLGALLYTDRGSLLFSEEGLNIIRPLMLGGATSMFCGCAAVPPPWLKAKYGIDLDDETAETIDELDIQPLPEELRGRASTRIAQIGISMGQDWRPMPVFKRPGRVQQFDCGAKCMLGCRCGAKWNAAEFVDEATTIGAELRTSARVERVLIEDGHAVGVEGRLGRRRFEARADTVVLSAGGIGTASILRASGWKEAGDGIAMDTTAIVYGFTNEEGTGGEPPMSWFWEDPERGYMLSALIDPWLLYPLMAGLKSVRHSLRWPSWNRALGVMIKLKDEVSGGLLTDGKISKPLTETDGLKLTAAEQLSRRILVQAGADPETIFTTPLRGTHPSATVRIGHLLDLNLQTEIKGLYACDASTFPEALGQPTVLTIIGLAKRLAKHLIGADSIHEKRHASRQA
ncbi:MAG: GMC family oxidoreductase N-terminal domain-containing protein [Chloroflexi bacterium]|nr:GMC family oxidoreductase N-terminal domain-containing protein [Chloroflexota bacterium]